MNIGGGDYSFKISTISNAIMENLKKHYKDNFDDFPDTKSKLEEIIDAEIAGHSFLDASPLLGLPDNSFMKDRSNKKLIKECEIAIETLKNAGGEYLSTGLSYEYLMKRYK
jgi:hypothetical protein